MLKVDVDKIVPVTDARDNFNKIIEEVDSSDEMYVLTKNGTPVAVVVGVNHLEKLTGTPAGGIAATSGSSDDDKKKDANEKDTKDEKPAFKEEAKQYDSFKTFSANGGLDQGLNKTDDVKTAPDSPKPLPNGDIPTAPEPALETPKAESAETPAEDIFADNTPAAASPSNGPKSIFDEDLPEMEIAPVGEEPPVAETEGAPIAEDLTATPNNTTPAPAPIDTTTAPVTPAPEPAPAAPINYELGSLETPANDGAPTGMPEAPTTPEETQTAVPLTTPPAQDIAAQMPADNPPAATPSTPLATPTPLDSPTAAPAAPPVDAAHPNYTFDNQPAAQNTPQPPTTSQQ